ncbi:MAG: class I SAM-dependent methyltransferase [Acidobacteria bacterium]|nr:class I SAM-dependent methyltransferase [Acidobacteriota bacterium]
MSLQANYYLALKRLVFPGLDIGIRDRLKLARYFRAGDIQTLDAGCGNGAFSLRAYQLGNRVVGISIDSEAITRNRQYADYIEVPPERVQFLVCNIYDAPRLGQTFDQIICFETLEHLQRDDEVIRNFSDILNPGGLLHLCTPYRGRQAMFGDFVSDTEDGGHVRRGYTYEELETLVVRAGLKPRVRDAVGGYGQMQAANIHQWVQVRFTTRFSNTPRQLVHLGLFWMLRPLLLLDRIITYPPVSIYVMAEKEALVKMARTPHE